MMKYEYWGYIVRHDDGSWEEKQKTYEPLKPIGPCQLPEEFKTKIAMMDFMKDYEELPCGSYKVHYDRLKFFVYFMYI